MEECRRLLSPVTGADHLAFRFLIQLACDEAIVEGASARVKTQGISSQRVRTT
jgi:hypothetical protein